MALSGHRRTPRRHHGQRRELLLAAMLQPHAAAWQACKACSKAASDSHLPPTECSLRSGCTVDESYSAGTHNSTLRGRGRSIKRTWVRLSVVRHGAGAPAMVGARNSSSAACLAPLLQDGCRWVPMLPAHVVVRWRVLASPIALDERYRTGQVWDLADGQVGRERYPTTCGAQNVTFSQQLTS